MIGSLILLQLLLYVNCNDNFTMEDSALFYRMETSDGHRDPETEKSVQSIISWLQKRYRPSERKVRTNEDVLAQFHPQQLQPQEQHQPQQQTQQQQEYDSVTMEPRPFGFSDVSAINNELPTGGPSEQPQTSTTQEPVSNNEIYPPQVQTLNVECQKDRMTVDVEFTTEFNGIIYSKDHYTNPECRYVVADSHSSRYRFTVQLNSCGTQFVNEFDKNGKAFLENVLVIQNEPGIVEIWDSVRSVRCLWEGSIRQQVTSGLSVVTPSTELVTFSGDTATAKLEIQTGRGPFSYAEQKPTMIGDMMTLVISVEGDPEHMIRVGKCTAAGGTQEMQLSDDAGCPVRPKLMTAFEYTRNPQTNGAMAYSYFRAFKFPDSNELNFDCNVELCKTPCVPCQDPNNALHRRKRSNTNYTSEDNDVLRIRNNMWVSSPTNQIHGTDVCMAQSTFYTTTALVMMVLVASVSITSRSYLTTKRLKGEL